MSEIAAFGVALVGGSLIGCAVGMVLVAVLWRYVGEPLLWWAIR